MRMARGMALVAVVSRLSCRSCLSLSLAPSTTALRRLASVPPSPPPAARSTGRGAMLRRPACGVEVEGGGSTMGGEHEKKKGRSRRRRRKRDPEYLAPEDAPFAYHEEIELTIETLTNLGDGVGRVKLDTTIADAESRGYVVLVPGVLPGERVRARIWQTKKNHALADLVHVIDPSPGRIPPPCPLFGECGGCQYQYMAIEDQRRWKRQHVAECLSRIGGISCTVGQESRDGEVASDLVQVQPVVGTAETYGYRSKLTPHYDTPAPDGTVGAIGFKRKGRPGLVDVEQCLIATDAINSRLKSLREEVREATRLKVEEDRHAPPHLQPRKPRGATLLLRDARGGVETDSNAMVSEVVKGITFTFRAGEFFQNNPFVLPKMVDHVVDEATRGGQTQFLIDAYCGGGLFSLCASPYFQQCLGIEISELNIAAAQRNAEANAIRNCNFVTGTAEDIFQQAGHFDAAKTALIIDPPRKGCSDEFLDQVFAFQPHRIVYVSCEPSTQARDAAKLVAGHAGNRGYQISNITPFDLFPQTRHIENVMTFDLARPESE